MHVIRARNVNSAFVQGIELIRQYGVARKSRYGDVLEIPEPVTTVYEKPLERVLFDPIRDANPFFHLFEALWILAGRNDVAWLAQFNKRMAEFSDNGETFHGAYGKRLRNWNGQEAGGMLVKQGMDQLAEVVKLLRKDPETRRAVVSIYDPEFDLGTSSKDIPCNDTIKFESRDNVLNMTVFCRSNDMIWGAYGANAVQFSFLLEYVAGMLMMEVGAYYQVSCNFHVYKELWQKQPWSPNYLSGYLKSPYETYGMASYPLVTNPTSFEDDLRAFFRWAEDENWDETYAPNNGFFTRVAMPMYLAWQLWKAGDRNGAVKAMSECAAHDWCKAGTDWMLRRINK